MTLALCLALLLPAGTLAAQPVDPPPDVAEDAWYTPYMRVCLEEGLMETLADGNFHPDQELFLADLTALAVRFWSITEPDEAVTASRQELMDEFEQTKTADAPATREDFCVLLGRNMKSPVYRRSWSETADGLDFEAYTMYMTGVMVGTGDGFALDRALTRGEAAAFLARLAHPQLRAPDEVPPHREPEDLSQIELSFGSFGRTLLEHKLDLEGGKLWRYEMPDENSDSEDDSAWRRNDGRDPHAENEGYQLREELSQAQVAAFRASAALQQALTWGRHYRAAYVFDGLQWRMTLTFSDGSVWKIEGSNAFPEGWDAFYVLFSGE